eukprot:Em0039g18a
MTSQGLSTLCHHIASSHMLQTSALQPGQELVDLNVWVLLVAKAMVVSVFKPQQHLRHLEISLDTTVEHYGCWGLEAKQHYPDLDHVPRALLASTITEAGMYSGAAARAAELRKHTQNDSKCAELSWKCIPLAVECYGAWGPEALKAFSQVATRLAIRGNTSKSMALTDLFGRLSHSLIRANARAILSRSYSHLMQQVDEL